MMAGYPNLSIMDTMVLSFPRLIIPIWLQDEYDLGQLYDILENEILPLYYTNYTTWRQVMKNGMQDVRLRFDSNRMANEYYELLYGPA